MSLSVLLAGHAWADDSAPLPVAPMLPTLELQVPPLKSAPLVDGNLDEWGEVKPYAIPVSPTLEKDARNRVGKKTVELRVGIFDNRFYLAARWPDDAPDEKFRPWRWRDGKYRRTETRDDQFVIRFRLSGDYDACMLGKSSYQADVWRWSAGRSNPAGLAEDQLHIISLEPMEDAAEYRGPHGMVYIIKRNDAGQPFYKNAPEPTAKGQDEEPGILQTGPGSGSLVDVQARGVWREGFWHLEMSRALNTGHEDDVILGGGQTIPGAIAIFDREGNEHKSVSGTLNFIFPP
ncbi:MAG: hypothetical protein HQL95_13910 [Magnetococcales bacterium]|nr:hypothetical protein [Magnetococcales bacterium]